MLIKKERGKKMKLKSIRAYGFKSFADKMDMEFKTSITAIVGPNGSGKSNIVDAVRWVLGEQSVKSLRGNASMSDVIFAGSETRNAFKRAEVALSFDNTDHFLNTDLIDVEVKRILYYTGENEYFINNAKVRLKDITNLFLDSGIGNDSFNIISQGNIEAIVNSKPVDRRVILEGAAQVLKYKNRKTESLRKLEKTKDNLEKIDFVIRELSETVEPLKEQSEVAKKYLGFKEELEDLEISLATYDITTMHREYDKLNSLVTDLMNQKEALEFSNNKDTSSTEKMRLELLQIEEAITKLNEEFITCNEEISKLNSEKTLLLERQNYEVDTEKISSEILKLKEEELQLQKQRELTELDYSQVDKVYRDLENKKRDLEEEKSLFRIKYNHFRDTLEQNVKELQFLQNKIDILESNIEADASVPYAVKNVLNNPRLTGVHNTIGKLLDVSKEYTTAIDTALASSSNFIVVENEEVAKKAIFYLKENKLGRATFFPLNVIKPRYIKDSVLNLARSVKGFIGVASDLITNDSQYDDIFKNQLGNVFVVDSLDASSELGRKTDFLYRIVTLDGEMTHAGGSITGGFLKKQNSSLKEKQELREKKKEFDLLENKMLLLEKQEAEYKLKKEKLEEEYQVLENQLLLQHELLEQKEAIHKKALQKLEEVTKKISGASSIKQGSLEEDIIKLMEALKEKEMIKEKMEKELASYKKLKSEKSSSIAELEQVYRHKNSEFLKIEQELKKNEITLSKYDTKMDYLLNLLSEEYHITYEKARTDYSLEIEPDLARLKVTSIKKDMASLGDVNLGSISEYERMSGRYNFLLEQKEDLETASNELLEIIHEMDEIMEERLTSAFQKVQEEFSVIFKKMFKGGTGVLKLTDPDNILETGIEIVAEPPGKKLNNIQLLSGGEKTLTAISLLFAILNVYPVPFCILDEVEAALDEANVDTFGEYLQEQKDKSEFILITHKKRTMEYAGTLYGITMQEQGVSKVVSVKLEGEKIEK